MARLDQTALWVAGALLAGGLPSQAGEQFRDVELIGTPGFVCRVEEGHKGGEVAGMVILIPWSVFENDTSYGKHNLCLGGEESSTSVCSSRWWKYARNANAPFAFRFEINDLLDLPEEGAVFVADEGGVVKLGFKTRFSELKEMARRAVE